MRKVIRGTGITAQERVITELESADDARRVFGPWNQSIKEGGGIFGAVSLDAARTCARKLAVATEASPAEDSPEFFARSIVDHIDDAKARIRDGNADQAARAAWDAGVLWAKAMMKWQWENDAMRGATVAAGARDGADKTNSHHRAQRERRLALMDERVQELGSPDSAAAECEVLLGEAPGARHAIKRQWYRYRPKEVRQRLLYRYPPK